MDELKLSNMLLKCINEIGDYFEYRHESEKDKAVVMGKICQLTKDLKSKVTKNEKV